tara:strand:- start:193 stop:441 length:249 start_codon:yes stop_codon:yes gene_type:complete
MPKHKLMVRETSKFIVEIEAPTEQEAQDIFEKNIKEHGDKITKVLFTEWKVLKVNDRKVQKDTLEDEELDSTWDALDILKGS